MELLNENGGLHNNVEFDYKEGEFVDVVYTVPENDPFPLKKKSTKFPQLQNFPHLIATMRGYVLTSFGTRTGIKRSQTL